MNYTVFFAYQTDIDEKYGKAFVQSAVESAIEKFKKNGINITLDFGFRGTPGTPPLLDEMLKKSSQADMVIVDMSFTSSKIWSDAKRFRLFGREIRILNNVKDKISPNPNVLLETGFAWAQKGTYRTLMVMNEAFGNASQLPVDLKGFRWGIRYNLDENNYTQNEKIKKDLADDFYKAIKTSINSEPEYQREKWKPLRLRADWKSKDFQNAYMPTIKIKSIIGQLREALENSENSQRIIGQKNSGKTRLAFELYNEIDATLPKHPSGAHVLYYDLELGNFTAIESKLLDLQEAKQKKILIIDNCSYSIHKKIFDEFLFNSNVSLLTIGNDIGDGRADFVLDSSITREIMEVISNEIGNPRNTPFIVNSSNDNLRNAIALINAFAPGQTELSLDYDKRWAQIIGTQLMDNKGLILLEALSLFTHVGYTDNFQYQSDFIIEQAAIESREHYEELINQLAEKGIIKITGDFIILEAFVEELANKRLENLAKEDVNLFFKKLTDHHLSKQFSNRFVELSKTKGFNTILKTFDAKESIIRQYDFINSDQGARILMNLAGIQPRFTLDVITEVLDGRTTEKLISLSYGRRYLVWTLERLVFRRETFKDAAKLLFRLSVAENENIGNNATAQFIHLFQILLPGTETSLIKRQLLLEELLETAASEAEQAVLLKAMDNALRVRGFSRMGSADQQGGDLLRDYKPEDKEIHDYWKKIMHLLLERNESAILIGRFNDQIYNGSRDEMINIVEKIVENAQSIDPYLRDQFDHILNDNNGLPAEIIARIEVLTKKYAPKTVREQLEYLVVKPPYLHSRDQHGRWINKSEERAGELAETLLRSEDESWINEIDILLKGEQRLSFSFGRYIGTHKKEWEPLINAIVVQLSQIPVEQQNSVFLEGYISSITNQEFIRNTIEQLLEKNITAHHAIRVSRFLMLRSDDLQKLYPLVEKNPKLSILMEPFNLGEMPDEERKLFFDWLKNIHPYGPWVAVEICAHNAEQYHMPTEMIRGVLKVVGILKGEGIYSPLSFHDYVDLVKLIDEQGLDKEFVVFLANEINIASENSSVNEYHLKELLDILFFKYWETSWEIIALKFQDQNFWGWYHQKDVLRSYKNYNADDLIAWMDKYPDNAPQKIIEIIDWTVSVNGETKLSPLLLQMLDKYSHNKDMLDHFSSSLHSYSWAGSVIPLLESRKNMLTPLLQHTNPIIQEFAQQQVKYFEDRIGREKKEELNENLDE